MPTLWTGDVATLPNGMPLGNPGGTLPAYGIGPSEALIEAALLPFGRDVSGAGEPVLMWGGKGSPRGILAVGVSGLAGGIPGMGSWPSPLESQQSATDLRGQIARGLAGLAGGLPGLGAADPYADPQVKSWLDQADYYRAAGNVAQADKLEEFAARRVSQLLAPGQNAGYQEIPTWVKVLAGLGVGYGAAKAAGVL